jgi:hypothetical protein
MKFKVEGNRADVTAATPERYCAEEGTAISTLDHLKALERESRADKVRRIAMEKLTDIEAEYHNGMIGGAIALAKTREVVHEILRGLGLEAK